MTSVGERLPEQFVIQENARFCRQNQLVNSFRTVSREKNPAPENQMAYREHAFGACFYPVLCGQVLPSQALRGTVLAKHVTEVLGIPESHPRRGSSSLFSCLPPSLKRGSQSLPRTAGETPICEAAHSVSDVRNALIQLATVFGKSQLRSPVSFQRAF